MRSDKSKHTYSNILATGLSGMVGSCIADHLSDRFQFEDLSIDTGIDIRDQDVVVKRMEKSDAPIVLHLAAKADVDACEEDQTLDIRQQTSEISEKKEIDVDSIDWKKWKDTNTAFAVNVVGTLNIAEACRKTNKKLIYVSTDFVFDGKKKQEYTEDDTPNPINYYGMTKYWGEQVVKRKLNDSIILRLAFPYGTNHGLKKDFVRSIISYMETGTTISGVYDQLFTPTYAPDIAEALALLIYKDASGIYHVVGEEALSPYKAVVAIAKQFGYDTQIIKKTTASKYYQDKAPRPQYLKMNNEKITQLGAKMKTFEEGLKSLQ